MSNETTTYGFAVKEDSGSRRHGSSKTIHVLTLTEDGKQFPKCSPRDIGLKSIRRILTAADVTCKVCMARFV